MSERQLVLIRHAKTAEGHPDIERTLTDRGRADAAELGRLLTAAGVRPQRAVVSPAARARETWTVIGLDAELVIDDRIYDNHVDALLAVIRETPEAVDTVVLVGHNPSFGALAHQLSDDVDDFPTAAVAVFAVSGPWADFDGATPTFSGVGRSEN